MQKYRSFLVGWPSQANAIQQIAVPGEWRLSTIPDRSCRHWTNRGETVRSEAVNAKWGKERARNDDDIKCKELIINSNDESTAENVQSLICCGSLLAYPNVDDIPNLPVPLVLKSEDEDWIATDDSFSRSFTFLDNLLIACEVARRAWGNSELIYATQKYRFSLHLASFTPHSAAPHRGKIFTEDPQDYEYHVFAAYAIVSAFAAIEELGMEIRSSRENPRFSNVETAEWNPEVWNDVELRLSKKGVNLDESFLWLHRGEPTAVEQEVTPRFGKPAEYSNDDDVRDLRMHVIEALHYASYIRNFFSAHAFSEITKDMSPYDVFNIQQLARRLVLESLNLWRVQNKDLSPS